MVILTCEDCIYFCRGACEDLDKCGVDESMICNRSTPVCCCYEDCVDEEE